MGDRLSPNDMEKTLAEVIDTTLRPFDLLPQSNLVEKVVALVLQGPPPGPPSAVGGLVRLVEEIRRIDTSNLKVVVFGGGSGLSNVIGGDSRSQYWPADPFHGLKEVFPNITAVLCVTDDGGSTGELLKDLPVIGLGDLRHVLLSAVSEVELGRRYGLGRADSLVAVRVLFELFNCRLAARPASVQDSLVSAGADLSLLPADMRESLVELLTLLFVDPELSPLLDRPHCLGNLLLVAAIHRHRQGRPWSDQGAVVAGIKALSVVVGVRPDAVLPVTTTPSKLRILYANGVLVTGEYKSSQALRNCPVDRVFLEFSGVPQVPVEVFDAVAKADLILFAPGSLYTSIVPILQVPGIVDAVRANWQARKILLSNLWAQKGETDLVGDDPRRRYYVSDLLKAYHRNIPGGVAELFRLVLVLGLRDIPGSVLQNYAMEGKVPIYLDREEVVRMGFIPVEANIYSQETLDGRGVLQHDPAGVARALHAAWGCRHYLPVEVEHQLPPASAQILPVLKESDATPDRRLREIKARLGALTIDLGLVNQLAEVLWRHPDVPLAHLEYFSGVELVAAENWRRSQEWDRIYCYFDPVSRMIRIRDDIGDDHRRLEIGFLVALGQSLLGNYASAKEMRPVVVDGEVLGKVYCLSLCPETERHTYFSTDELAHYLSLARMVRSATNSLVHTRLVNNDEGFTPPGLLFGLVYAWYLDNSFVAHIESKMAVRTAAICELIPEQVKTRRRLRTMVDFFRQVVFDGRCPSGRYPADCSS